MKVEEIKLAFETNVQFSRIDELNKKLSETSKKFTDVFNEIKRFSVLNTGFTSDFVSIEAEVIRAINTAKELGLDHKPLQGILDRANAGRVASQNLSKKIG
jgi:hypothetical protein